MSTHTHIIYICSCIFINIKQLIATYIQYIKINDNVSVLNFSEVQQLYMSMLVE